ARAALDRRPRERRSARPLRRHRLAPHHDRRLARLSSLGERRRAEAAARRLARVAPQTGAIVPRLILLAVTLWTGVAFAVVAERGHLVAYSFDDGRVETGPDTFIVFEHAKGHVDLSEDVWVTPSESVVIEDVPGDGEFPELQGYFPQVDAGKLYVQFYLMPT